MSDEVESILNPKIAAEIDGQLDPEFRRERVGSLMRHEAKRYESGDIDAVTGPVEPAVYGSRMKFASPLESRHRRRMALPNGIKIATPEEAAYYGADWSAITENDEETDLLADDTQE